MFLKCLWLFFILGDINAQYSLSHPRTCPYPRFDHGRFRMRQKSKLIKFICFPNYELVGNKYATCRDGEWDVPIPVCVKPGCQLPLIENGIPMTSHGGAWVVFFCFPQHKLVGSPALYCDGRRWNTTAPTCVDTTTPINLSCDFEDPNLCGWTQDELHDFDWKRHNMRTPSSFLFTGPPHDHTFGEKGNGYYMYIESTSRRENDTARLISPIYDAALTTHGCFSFYYHMYGRTIGGLRVYQKPEKFPLPTLLQLSEAEKKKYILFEKWENQGDTWFTGVVDLLNVTEDFQIIIEGIRGKSFTSDIAIDDVSILQGENCTVAKNTATTPIDELPDSCTGRCNVFAMRVNELGCGCSAACFSDSNCCADFYETCIFEGTTPQGDETPGDLPQTQKLIALNATDSTTSTSTSTGTTTTSTTTSTTTTTTQKPTTKRILTTLKPIVKITTSKPQKTSAPKIVTPGNKPEKVTKYKDTTTKLTTKVVNVKTTTFKPSYVNDKMKMEQERKTQTQSLKFVKQSTVPKNEESSGLKTSLVTITSLLLCAGVLWLVVYARSARGRAAIAGLRGRTTRDPDVRYLHSHADDRCCVSILNSRISSLLLCAGVLWLVVYARSARGRAAIAGLRGQSTRDPDVRHLHSHADNSD